MIQIYVGELFSERTTFTKDYFSLNWCPTGEAGGIYGHTPNGSPMRQSPYEHKFGFDRNIQLC